MTTYITSPSSLIQPFPEYAIGSSVECVRDTRAIGGVISSHVCNGVIERYTPTLVIVRNEHSNTMRFKRATSQAIANDRLTPTRLIKC